MLLDRLTDKQRELGLVDAEFGRLLGVPRSTWQLTRTRVKPLRWGVAVAAIKTFPEMEGDVALFLRSEATAVTEPESADTADIVMADTA